MPVVDDAQRSPFPSTLLAPAKLSYSASLPNHITMSWPPKQRLLQFPVLRVTHGFDHASREGVSFDELHGETCYAIGAVAGNKRIA